MEAFLQDFDEAALLSGFLCSGDLLGSVERVAEAYRLYVVDTSRGETLQDVSAPSTMLLLPYLTALSQTWELVDTGCAGGGCGRGTCDPSACGRECVSS